MHTTIKINDLPDDQELALTKKEFVNMMEDYATGAIYEFIGQCGKMAEANWCPSQVTMLERLFNRVLARKPYSDCVVGQED